MYSIKKLKCYTHYQLPIHILVFSFIQIKLAKTWSKLKFKAKPHLLNSSSYGSSSSVDKQLNGLFLGAYTQLTSHCATCPCAGLGEGLPQ